MSHFDHEKLDVYKLSITFVTLVESIVESLPSGRSYLADQLRRAAASIPLNIAEGAGEFSRAEKASFYRMARRSATECAAILDVLKALHLTSDAATSQGRELLLRQVAMLVAMSRNAEESGKGKR